MPVVSTTEDTDRNALMGPTWSVAVFVMFLALPCPGWPAVLGNVGQTVSAERSVDAVDHRREHLEQIVVDRLAFYATQYPEIAFVVLDSSGDVARNMHVLAQLIGEDPIPLDYAHPEDMRRELLFVTLMRIELLLQTDVGSSTLFKVGKGALASRKNVCVVTLDPWAIAEDDRSATLHLLDLPKSELDAIPPGRYLNHESHLRFALDHEIYHCLDSRYNGPQPMSHLEHWGDYMMLRDEAGADAFGVIMNIAAHGAITAYARTLRNVRGLALLEDDPNHYTYEAIGAALQMDPVALERADVRERFRIATKIRNRTGGDYDDYVRYAVAAYHAMKALGVQPMEEKFSRGTVDRELVQALVRQTRSCYRDLVGRDMPPVQPQKPSDKAR